MITKGQGHTSPIRLAASQQLGRFTNTRQAIKGKAIMVGTTPYVGQRLSLKGQACTVRYVGAVADKKGEWLGVEWDDASRGKHDGTHDGTSYFTCRSRLSYVSVYL